jgi:hypothetical protein
LFICIAQSNRLRHKHLHGVSSLTEGLKGNIRGQKLPYARLLDICRGPIKGEHDGLHVEAADLSRDLTDEASKVCRAAVGDHNLVEIARELHASTKMLHRLHVITRQMVKASEEIADQ